MSSQVNRNLQRRRVMHPTMILLVLFSAIVQHGVAFMRQQPRILYTPQWDYETFCKDGPKVQCWEIRRIRRQPFLSSSLLQESVEKELDVSIQVNGDSNSFLSSPDESSNGISVDGAAEIPLTNGPSGDGIQQTTVRLDELDVGRPTENGGFSHTLASRAKIGAANKGKIPWNKGKERSVEVKARIAAGVRAKNRERFLQKLKDMGLTEEEYEKQKKDERRKHDAERRARRTPMGGYRPTEETKAKISKILKEKHARGEIKRRPTDPSKVRRGFTHSDETKQRISDSLKKRWAEDEGYRERMSIKMKETYSKEEVRKKLSETLKKKWEDPEFRDQMTKKMKNRKVPSNSQEFREKMSKTMLEKWKDTEYREKTLNAIAKRNGTVRVKGAPRKTKPRRSSLVKGSTSKAVEIVQPLAPGETRKKKTKQKKRKVSIRVDADHDDDETGKIRVAQTKPKAKAKKATPKKAVKKKKEPDGSVNRLREERRDLFDLLYGDDDDEDTDDTTTPESGVFDLGDEDLDAFDPYGLDDY